MGIRYAISASVSMGVFLATTMTTSLFRQVHYQQQDAAFASLMSQRGLLGLLSSSSLPSSSSSTTLTFSHSQESQSQQEPLDQDFPFLQKLHGEGWTVWDGKSVLYQDAGFGPCRWLTYKVTLGNGSKSGAKPKKTAQICVHPHKDYVSDKIAQTGRWRDCSILGDLWTKYLAASEEEANGKNKTFVHVDIGANIGSCVVDLLLTLPENVQLVLFEPNPRNLVRLTSTLLHMANDTTTSTTTSKKNVLDRVRLFPIGLGRGPAQDKIYGASQNLGHSVVGQVIQQSEGEPFEDGLPIAIERLDDIIMTSSSSSSSNTADFAVAKLDAQGYECSIVEGMPQFLDHVHTVSFESDGVLLKAFNCSAQHLWDSFVDGHGLTITDRQFRNKGRVAPKVRPGQRGTKGVQELLAVRQMPQQQQQ